MQTPATPSATTRVLWGLDAGLAAFAATTGALLVFSRPLTAFSQPLSSAFSGFADVGRRIARDIRMPYWGDATLGLVVHFGEAMVLGAITAALLGAGTLRTRLRAACVATLLWELAPLIPSFAAVRADVAAAVSMPGRIALAALLILALAFGPRASSLPEVR